MDQEEHESIANRLRTIRQRLHKLEEQKAYFGLSTAPHILIEIDEAHEEIEALKKRLNAPLAETTLDPSSSVVPLPRGSRMLYSHNPLFVGRNEVFRRIISTFQREKTIALTGLSGIGKTSLAIEFAHLYGQRFEGGVFWLSFANAASIPAEIVACGNSMNLYKLGFDSLSLDERLAAVYQEWHKPIPRLLVFDNCEDEQLLQKWRPTTGECYILVTSRRSMWNDMLNVWTFELTMLSEAESLALFQMLIPNISEDIANAIATRLDHLPLALYLAAAYLKTYQHVVQPTLYLEELNSDSVLNHPSFVGRGITVAPADRELHLERAFEISFLTFDIQNSTDADAVNLAIRMSCLAPGKPVSRKLIYAMMGVAEDQDRDRLLRIEDSIIRLTSLGFIQDEGVALRMHRLLQEFFCKVIPKDVIISDVEAGLAICIQENNFSSYISMPSDVRSHLQHVAGSALQRSGASAAIVCATWGGYLSELAAYDEAIRYLEHAYSLVETNLEMDDRFSIKLLNNLAYLFLLVGRQSEAMLLFKRAVAMQELSSTSQNEDAILLFNNIGQALISINEIDSGRVYLDQALDTALGRFGEYHPYTAAILNNIGTSITGDNAKLAQSYINRAIKIHKHFFGRSDLRFAKCILNLGLVLLDRKKIRSALICCHYVMDIQSKLLPDGHPEIAITLAQMAFIYRNANNFVEARRLFEQAIAIHESSLGSDHPGTIAFRYQLAEIIEHSGDLELARHICEELITVQQGRIGTIQPDIASGLVQLSLIAKKQGDIDSERAYLKRALLICEKVYGTWHEHTRKVRNNLSALDEPSNPEFIRLLINQAKYALTASVVTDLKANVELALKLEREVVQLKKMIQHVLSMSPSPVEVISEMQLYIDMIMILATALRLKNKRN